MIIPNKKRHPKIRRGVQETDGWFRQGKRRSDPVIEPDYSTRLARFLRASS